MRDSEARAAAGAGPRLVVGAGPLAGPHDHLPPVDLQGGEPVVCVERREMLVTAGFDEGDDAESMRRLVAAAAFELQLDPAELRSQQPSGRHRGRLCEVRLDERADRVEVFSTAHHVCVAFRASTIVMLRPSNVAVPSA